MSSELESPIVEQFSNGVEETLKPFIGAPCTPETVEAISQSVEAFEQEFFKALTRI